MANNGKRSRSSDLLGSYFRCDRRGTYPSEADPKKGTKSCTKKNGCKFRIRAIQKEATLDGVPGLYWGIVTFPSNGYHNHEMVDYSDGRLRHVGLDDEEKAYIEQQAQSQVAPKEIHHGLHLITPDKPRPTLRQVQDHSGKTRAEKRGDMNPAQYMLACIVENNYVHWHETNPETNELTHVFLAHPESVKLFRAYYHVIIMDSTYKTNTYGNTLVEVIGVTPTGLSFLVAAVLIPCESTEGYQWLLQKLALLLEPVGKVPSTIITDRELGLINAVPLVFPSSAHLLCTWHVNRAVEGKALAFYPNPIYRAYNALHSNETGWYLVVRATSEERYFRAWKWFSAKWGLLADYVDQTWGMHHLKFVKCYTNRVFHLGNTATSRVESSHSLLKSWLKSSNLKIDTMWSRIHPMLESQHSKIRAHLEKSRNKRRRNKEGQLFRELSFKVSMKAVDLMLHELERGRKLGEGLESGCGCVMKATHGLPCACQLVQLSRINGSVHLDDVHDFWKTLSYNGDSVNILNNNDVLEALLEEMRSTDPAQVGAYIDKLRECLHPEDSNVKEPAIRKNPKGRPKKSTKRNKSGFEHARRKHGGTPVTQPSVNTDKAVGDFPEGPPNSPSEVNYTKGPMTAFRGRYGIPEHLWEFFDGWYNPEPDGHCGYRVMSHANRGFERDWSQMREKCASEMEGHEVYKDLYGSSTGLLNALKWVNFEGTTGCLEDHWMSDTNLFAFAGHFNWTICMIGTNPHTRDPVHKWDCRTILPLRRHRRHPNPHGVLWIVLHKRHWMRLHPRAPSHDLPMPPVDTRWFAHKLTNAPNWPENLYAAQINTWHQLMGTTPTVYRSRAERRAEAAHTVRNLFGHDVISVADDGDEVSTVDT